jgi:hypothetical protein
MASKMFVDFITAPLKDFVDAYSTTSRDIAC